MPCSKLTGDMTLSDAVLGAPRIKSGAGLVKPGHDNGVVSGSPWFTRESRFGYRL